MAAYQTIKRILWAGVWWPTMRAEVYNFVRSCDDCQARPPRPHATLFQVAISPNWSKYIVDYLEQRRLPERVNKVRAKAIELESKDYKLIANQLYKRGKDKQLQLCVTETEYLRVLEQAHAGLSGIHFSADTTAKAIMMARLWWPTLFHDATEFVKRCDECQHIKVSIQRDNMPL